VGCSHSLVGVGDTLFLWMHRVVDWEMDGAGVLVGRSRRQAECRQLSRLFTAVVPGPMDDGRACHQVARRGLYVVSHVQ